MSQSARPSLTRPRSADDDEAPALLSAHRPEGAGSALAPQGVPSQPAPSSDATRPAIASREALGPTPFTEEDFRRLAGFSPAVRGDQPSEILPGLFLGGHPARFVKKGGGFPSYPHGSVHEKTGSTLIVNCCAAPSAAPHIIECVKDGTKTFHESSADCFAQAACDDQLVVVHNVAMVDDDEYPIGNDIHAVCRALAAALVPQWRAALESEAPGPSRIRGAFVHCQMGVSRSATVVIAFLMWAFGLDLEAALAFAETRRRCVSPNPGFHSMLRAF